MSDNPAMEMLGALMLSDKVPVRHILRANSRGLLLAEFTVTHEALLVMPTVTGMTVTSHWDHARYQQVYRAELEYGPSLPYRPAAYDPDPRLP